MVEEECQSVPMPVSNKLGGFEFWRQTLKSAKYVVAPMVDQSALAWRMLCRKHGAELCYTPMFHSKLFAEQESYRDKEFTTCPEDRPLIVQFCGNDPDTVLAAAKFVEDRCDAVDLNLGCPQGIAKKGFYGSYLQDEWDLIASIVKKLHDGLKVPVTCKIRIFPDVQKTIKYALMLQEAGCQLLTVHGRTREQRQQNTGLADWEQIKIVREALSIPVFANGNILFHEDIQKCLEATGVQGVMSAEGNLYNPFIFEPALPNSFQAAREYIECVRKYGGLAPHVRGHLFKILRPALGIHTEFRQRIGVASGLEAIVKEAEELISLVEADYDFAKAEGKHECVDMENIPHWFCQPYVRKLPVATTPTSEDSVTKRPSCSEEASIEPSAKEPKITQLTENA